MIRTPSDVCSLFVRPQLRRDLYQILAADSLDNAAICYLTAVDYWNNQHLDLYITSLDLAHYAVHLADAFRAVSTSLVGGSDA